MRKYWGYFLIELSRAKFYWQDVLLSLLLIALRLALPYSVFAILLQKNQISQSVAYFSLWSVLMGQLLNRADNKISRKIKNDIRTGDISIRLYEPANYVLAKLFTSMGYFVPYFFINGAIFILIFWLFIPIKINIILLLVFSVLTFLVYEIIFLNVGLTSFLIEENLGIELLIGKLFFILGNQVIPVILMPLWVQNFAKYTPFYLGLAGAIDVAAGRLSWQFALVACLVYFWIFFGSAQIMLKVLKRRMVING